MIRPGLCSITLRALAADEVLDVAVRAGLVGIEWGGDAHVPPGATRDAARLAARCRDAGVAVVSYGSYLGMAPTGDDNGEATEAALDTAAALGAPMIRIWTELGVTPESPPDDRARVVARTGRLADAAAARGLAAALEFHPFTLTHTAASAVAVLRELDRENLRTHWQPDPALAPDAALAELETVAPHVAHLHVFSWGAGGIAERRALAAGEALWPRAIACADARAPVIAGGRYALCEYVRDDDPQQLVRDAATLRTWLAAPSP